MSPRLEMGKIVRILLIDHGPPFAIPIESPPERVDLGGQTGSVRRTAPSAAFRAPPFYRINSSPEMVRLVVRMYAELETS